MKNSLELDEEDWGNGTKTNLNGTWLVSKHVRRRMREGHQGGSIINISSIIGINRGQHVGDVGYAASKTGINAMTKVFFFFFLYFGVVRPPISLPSTSNFLFLLLQLISICENKSCPLK